MKGTRFRGLRDAGDPAELARRYRDEGADELVFLDITATTSKRRTVVQMVKRVAATLDIPFTVGGGIRSKADVRDVLRSGADKVSINTAALENDGLVAELAETYGSQCIVIAIDAKRSSSRDGYDVYSHSGGKRVGRDAVSWARRVALLGAGELLVTSIDNDGTGAGFDLSLLRQMTSSVRLPVIASGGAGTPDHFYEALEEAGCDAALAASLFHYGKLSVKEVKEYLRKRGVCVKP